MLREYLIKYLCFQIWTRWWYVMKIFLNFNTSFLIVCKHNILSPPNHKIFFSTLMCLTLLEYSSCIFSLRLGDGNKILLLTSLRFWFSLSSFSITTLFFRAVIAAGVFGCLTFVLPLFYCAWFVLFKFLLTLDGV